MPVSDDLGGIGSKVKEIVRDAFSQDFLVLGGEAALILDGDGNPDFARTMQTVLESAGSVEGAVRPLFWINLEMGAIAGRDAVMWQKTDNVTDNERRVIEDGKQVFTHLQDTRGDVTSKLVGAALSAIVPG